MTYSSVIKGLALLLVLWSGVCNGQQQQRIEMAKMYRKVSSTSTTSSTLGWVSSQDGEQPPPGAVLISGSSDHWCRARQHSQWAAGAVRDKQCHYPFLTTVYQSDEYDTLVSINGSARLRHAEWNKFTNFPDSCVTTPEMMLAVLEDELTGVYKPGFVDYKERQPFFINGDEAEKGDTATLITEEEPKEYELFSILLDPKTTIKTFEDKVLSDIYLENSSTDEMLVESDEDYSVMTEQYWGSVKGTVKGIKFSTPEQSEMIWGDFNEGDIKHTQKVSYLLPPGAVVKGKLVANMSKLEAPYTASLTAIFADGFQITRPIASLHTDKRMAELRVDFEQPFILSDNSPVEGYNETSEILRHSTTTTTTSTTTTTTTSTPPAAPSEGGAPPQSAQVGVNGAGANSWGPGLLSVTVLVVLGSWAAAARH